MNNVKELCKNKDYIYESVCKTLQKLYCPVILKLEGSLSYKVKPFVFET